MSNPVQSVNINKSAGLCPHGNIPGACPICSGMGGGGLRVGERPQKAGEMSYHECAMIGAMMRAREAAQKEHELNIKKHIANVKAFEQNMQKIAHNLVEFVTKFQDNFLFKPITVIICNVVVPILNVLSKLPNDISNVLNKFAQIKEKLFDIQDKLTAIFGEAKAFIDKKVSELVSSIKSKIQTLFKVFQRDNIKDDETKLDEDKKIFRLKTLISKIFRKNKDNDSEDKPRS